MTGFSGTLGKESASATEIPPRSPPPGQDRNRALRKAFKQAQKTASEWKQQSSGRSGQVEWPAEQQPRNIGLIEELNIRIFQSNQQEQNRIQYLVDHFPEPEQIGLRPFAHGKLGTFITNQEPGNHNRNRPRKM